MRQCAKDAAAAAQVHDDVTLTLRRFGARGKRLMELKVADAALQRSIDTGADFIADDDFVSRVDEAADLAASYP